jgi:hypothetical protein
MHMAFGEPLGKPMPPSKLIDMLGRNLQPGQYGSFESPAHNGHIDHDLYRKTFSGDIHRLGHFRDPIPPAK